MKKMSIVTALIMLVTITTYSVSGTYAKYTSSIDLTDEARVAKWELNVYDSDSCVQVPGTTNWTCSPKKDNKLNLFADSYSVNEKGLYVKSLDGDRVMAPGTKGEYQVNFGGTMEVRHKFKVDFDGLNADPVVYYSVDAEGNVVESSITTEKFEGALEYRPIRYSYEFKDASSNELDGTEIAGKIIASGKNLTVKDLSDALAAIYNNADNNFGPRKLGQSLQISWAWADENTDMTGLSVKNVDLLDTYMGKNLSNWVTDSNKTDLEGNGSEFRLSVVVEQVAENYAEKTKN